MDREREYVFCLDGCRKEALAVLLEEYPGINGVFGRMSAFFTNISLRFDGVDVCDEGIQYKMLLAVSFMRTHICACEHIFNSVNIEAMVLLRKQLDLIARMKEVDVKDLEEVYDKVPNIAFGYPMNRLYGSLSTIAHIANIESLDMLGFKMEDDTHKHFAIYPVYSENTIFSFSVTIGLFMLFCVEMIHLQESVFPNYSIQEDGEAMVDFMQYGMTTNIPFFTELEGLEFGVNNRR